MAENSAQRNKHASTIIMNGKPVSVGINVARNNPHFVTAGLPYGVKANIFSTHAEQAAIRRAGNCAGGTLYVVRVSNGKPRMSMPCNYCMSAITNAGIKRVVFSTNAGIGIIKI